MSIQNAETSKVRMVSPFENANQEKLFAEYAKQAMKNSDTIFFWNDADMSETLSGEVRQVLPFANADQEKLFAKSTAESMDASIK